MAEFERVQGAAEAGLNLLADQVADELERAGLSVLRDGNADAGAEIEVDAGADEAGGVYVAWRPGSRLSLAAAVAVQQGRFDEPVIQHSGTVKRIMLDAISAILQSSRFSVEQSTDDMRPLAIRVTSSDVDAAR
ncbi:hypothetical protein ACIGD1_34065 [Streptomyces sp. NPDC085612]|uniref:hypothetical protein n=1 Tax=Streptomyces sp. NPDC085612 TaxID=3365732 RepID=UPI0037D5022E